MNRINTMTLKDPMHGDNDGITSAQIYAHFSQDAGGDLYRASEMHGASLRNKRPQVGVHARCPWPFSVW